MRDNHHIKLITIVNQRGLHARASAKLAKLANSYECKIEVTHKKNTASGKDILDLLTLAAGYRDEIKVETFNSEDSYEAIKSITKLIENGFDEEYSID